MEDALAQAIVNTIPEPFVVLDGEFRVLAATSDSIHQSWADHVPPCGKAAEVIEITECLPKRAQPAGHEPEWISMKPRSTVTALLAIT
jgi:hypothetical protein